MADLIPNQAPCGVGARPGRHRPADAAPAPSPALWRRGGGALGWPARAALLPHRSSCSHTLINYATWYVASGLGARLPFRMRASVTAGLAFPTSWCVLTASWRVPAGAARDPWLLLHRRPAVGHFRRLSELRVGWWGGHVLPTRPGGGVAHRPMLSMGAALLCCPSRLAARPSAWAAVSPRCAGDPPPSSPACIGLVALRLPFERREAEPAPLLHATGCRCCRCFRRCLVVRSPGSRTARPLSSFQLVHDAAPLAWCS